MLLNGDMKKIQDGINKVLVPLAARVEALEAEVAKLSAPAPKAAPKAKTAS